MWLKKSQPSSECIITITLRTNENIETDQALTNEMKRTEEKEAATSVADGGGMVAAIMMSWLLGVGVEGV